MWKTEGGAALPFLFTRTITNGGNHFQFRSKEVLYPANFLGQIRRFAAQMKANRISTPLTRRFVFNRRHPSLETEDILHTRFPSSLMPFPRFLLPRLYPISRRLRSSQKASRIWPK